MRTGTGTGIGTGIGTGREIQRGWSKNLKKGGIEEEVKGKIDEYEKRMKRGENRRVICRANKTRKMLQKLYP